MTRQSRLILVLAVMAGVGVGTLAFVAHQYRKALAAHPNAAPAEATRLVDGFLAARQAVRAVDGRYSGSVRGNPEALAALRNERYAAFTAHRMTIADYVAVRAAWRAARAGSAIADAELAETFRTRSSALDDAALRPDLDELDDELK